MRKKHQLLVLALLAAPLCYAQTETDTTTVSKLEEEIHQESSSFVLSESQLGEDDDQTVNIIQVGSANNVYTNNIGYLWSPVRFKFRAYDSRYNDVYMNGVMVNNIENGRFNFSTIGVDSPTIVFSNIVFEYCIVCNQFSTGTNFNSSTIICSTITNSYIIQS